MKNKISTYDIVVIGLMAAMVFVTTYFIKIEIVTPAGPTMLKVANIICLSGGLLFGGLRGGLAAGIGSMFYDLLDPKFVASAPFTLVFFFIMAFICGSIAHSKGQKGLNTKLNIVAAICGAGSYIILYISKSIITLMLAGSAFAPALTAVIPKMITSSVNATIAVIASVILAPILHKALDRAGIYNHIKI